MSIPVFVISLASSYDRRANTKLQLEQAGISFSLTDAVDGRIIPVEDLRNNHDYAVFKSGIYTRYLRKEEIGCTLSHLSIFRKIVEDNIPLTCVLEDDNIYSSDFRELLETIEKDTDHWDLLYLGHRSGCTLNAAEGRKTRILKTYDYAIGEPFEVPMGSHAYIISLKAAKILLDNAYPLKAPFDVYLGNSAAFGIRTMLLQPPCATSNPLFVSTIQDENTIIVSNPFSGNIRNILKKNRVIFGILKNSTIKFRILHNSVLLFLRKSGIIKNRYARLLK
jgi:glycosyl transferase, family 25